MRTLCIWHLQYLQSFRNGCLFCKFCLLPNFYSGDAQRANYGKQFKSSFPTLRTLSIWDLQCFQTFRNGCLFCTLWLIRNFYSGHEQYVKYCKHSLNHHFQHCAPCVYEIYNVFELLKIAVCFAHFGFFEIWTPLILTMLTMVHIAQIIISDIAYSVYLRFTVFWNFSKLLFVLHISAYSKFLLRWGASC